MMLHLITSSGKDNFSSKVHLLLSRALNCISLFSWTNWAGTGVITWPNVNIQSHDNRREIITPDSIQERSSWSFPGPRRTLGPSWPLVITLPKQLGHVTTPVPAPLRTLRCSWKLREWVSGAVGLQYASSRVKSEHFHTFQKIYLF